MSGTEVIQLLDDTVDWYRTLGTQQQIANEPSDLLILSENRQIANQVLGLAFDVARANADLIAKDTADAPPSDEAAASSQTLAQRQKKLDAQTLATQSELDATRRTLAQASKKAKAQLQAKADELQGELDLIGVKKNILVSMAGVVSGNGSSASSSVGALRSQIEAMAVALPASGTPAPVASGATASPSQPRSTAPAAVAASPLVATAAGPESSRFGLWDLAADVVKLSKKSSSIDNVTRNTQELQNSLGDIRTRIIAQMRALSAQGDALMAQADSGDSAALNRVHDQLDALAAQFKQASVIFIPLSKQSALLNQYRRNLKNWHDAVRGQSRDALKSLGVRLAVLLAILGVVYASAEIWRRTVVKYVHDTRRRYQLLLLRRIALWSLVVVIIGFAFASELGSIVTFAGLITAGLAVAMQSVLVSIVGYFFLIGKYGIRIGDRVQIGEVSGEVIELGLVRMYLMELAGHGASGPTGRVAAFPNSVVFQVSSGLFKQIPGVNFTWHDITLSLPAGIDFAAAKEKLTAAANEALGDYREEIHRQSLELERTTLSGAGGNAAPTVQLSYAAKGVDARVRYPVNLTHAAEIDERMSKALLQVISGLTPKEPVGA